MADPVRGTDDRYGRHMPQAQDRPGAAVFDIDGVLADVRHRLHHVAARPKDWDAFFAAAPEDPPLPEGLAAVATARDAGQVVLYVTGRPERCRADTLAWLAAHGLPAGELVMRDDADRRPARVTKLAALRRLSRRVRVEVFVDDDAAVVAMVRGAGFPVRHAEWMARPAGPAAGGPAAGGPAAGGPNGMPSAQDVLFEIQEAEGRT